MCECVGPSALAPVFPLATLSTRSLLSAEWKRLPLRSDALADDLQYFLTSTSPAPDRASILRLQLLLAWHVKNENRL